MIRHLACVDPEHMSMSRIRYLLKPGKQLISRLLMQVTAQVGDSVNRFRRQPYFTILKY